MADDALSPEQVSELRKQVEQSKAIAAEATQRADTAESQVRQSSTRLAEGQVAQLESSERQAATAIVSLDEKITNLKKQRTELLQEGKFEEEADLNEQLSVAVADRKQAIQARDYFKGEREKAAAQPTDPVERFLSERNYSDGEKDWIRRNTRYATDRQFMDRVNAAHQKAVEGGINRGTPDYFKALEDAGYQRQAQPDPARRRNGEATPDDAGIGDGEGPYSAAADTGGEELDDTPRPRPTAAPPSRRSPTTPPGARQGEVRLTPDQAAAALAAAEYFPLDVQNEGEPAIYAYWAKLNQSPMAARLRDQWRQGA